MFFKHYVGYWIQHSKLFLSAYLSCRLCASKLFLVSIIIKKRWSTILCNIMYMQLLCNILCNKNVHIRWASFLFITIITVYYCEVLLLSFCTEFCASVDSNGGKAHVVSYVYVVDMLSTNLCWKGTFCAFLCELLQVLENERLLLPKCWFVSVSVRNRHS
jgi:hypothetical protein